MFQVCFFGCAEKWFYLFFAVLWCFTPRVFMGWVDQTNMVTPDPSIINRVGSNSWVQSDWKKSNPNTSGYNNKIKSYAHCVLCCPPSRVCNNKLMRHALDCKGLHNLLLSVIYNFFFYFRAIGLFAFSVYCFDLVLIFALCFY